MSDDLMLHGVLNMPLPDDPTECDLVTWVQFKARAREASDRIEALTAKLAEADAERDEAYARGYHDCQHKGITEGRLQIIDSPKYQAAEARERDAFERGFKAALEEAAEKVAEPWAARTRKRAIEAIRAIPLPDTKGDDT